MKIEIFGKQGCARCQATKRKLSHFLEKWGHAEKIEFAFVDMETVDGMAEGAFQDVTEVPTTIIWDRGGALVRWEGEVPPSEDVKRIIEERL
jgi:glutaredoxin